MGDRLGIPDAVGILLLIYLDQSQGGFNHLLAQEGGICLHKILRDHVCACLYGCFSVSMGIDKSMHEYVCMYL